MLVIILVSGKYLEVSGRDGSSLAINSFENASILTAEALGPKRGIPTMMI